MASSPQDPSLTSNAPNSLIQLEIAGAMGPLPVTSAEPGKALWGINHGAALDNFPQNGLQLYIRASSAMSHGHNVAVSGRIDRYRVGHADGQWESKPAVPERTSHQVWILGNGAPSRVRYFAMR